MQRRDRALLLAVFQLGDLVVTQVSPKYGSEHLDRLGVPTTVRRALPLVKTVAVAALLATSNRSAVRVVGGALVSYYSAAATLHLCAGDSPLDVAPAAACAVVAATLV